MAAIAVRRIENEVDATVLNLGSASEAIRYKAFPQFHVALSRERVNDLDILAGGDYRGLEQATPASGGQLEGGLIRINSSEGPPGQAVWN
jgi:hypothetical protein